jgi:hypothetical protein
MADYNFTVRSDISGTNIVDMSWFNYIGTPNNLFVARSNAPQVMDLYKGFIIYDVLNVLEYNSCTCIAFDGATVYLAHQINGAAYLSRINRSNPASRTRIIIFPLVSIIDMVYYNGAIYLTDGNRLYQLINPNSYPNGIQVVPIEIVLNPPIPPIPIVTINTLAIVFDELSNDFLYFGTDRINAISLAVAVFPNTNLVIEGPQTSPPYPIQCIAWEPASPDAPRVWIAANNQLYELRPGGFVEVTTNIPSGSVIKSIAFDTLNRLNIATTSQVYTSNDPFCFNEGTKILCLKKLMDEYISIEKLKIGDFVKTFKHGYRKISKVIKGSFRNNPNRWNMCMYKMAKTDSNGLLEDLIVTGGHSLLVDSITEEDQSKYDEMGLTEFSKETIDGKRLLLACVSDQFTAMSNRERYTYYHLLLENNDDVEERFGIYANGILTETPNSKN